MMEPGSYYNSMDGQYSPHAGFQAWGILGSLAISQTVPAEAVEFLKNLAQPDGGWEWNQGFGTDTNTTSLVIQTLIAAGELPDAPIVSNALNYLKSAQNTDGGFTYSPKSEFGTDSDVNSTSYVVQAILAVGQSPITATWTISETNPIEYLLGMQLENGSFEWQKGSGKNLVATAQAATALLGKSYPIRIADLSTCP
jgi:prenyltransferase beta subunit